MSASISIYIPILVMQNVACQYPIYDNLQQPTYYNNLQQRPDIQPDIQFACDLQYECLVDTERTRNTNYKKKRHKFSKHHDQQVHSGYSSTETDSVFESGSDSASIERAGNINAERMNHQGAFFYPNPEPANDKAVLFVPYPFPLILKGFKLSNDNKHVASTGTIKTEKPSEVPVEVSTEEIPKRLVGKPTKNTFDKPPDKPIKKLTENTFPKKTIKKPTENTKLANKPIEKPTENTKLANKPTEKPTENTKLAKKPIEKPTEPTFEKPTETTFEKPPDKPTENTFDKRTEKPTEKTFDKTTNKPIDKPVKTTFDKPTDKPVETTFDKPIDKPTENTFNKPPDKPINKPKKRPKKPGRKKIVSTSTVKTKPLKKYKIKKQASNKINKGKSKPKSKVKKRKLQRGATAKKPKSKQKSKNIANDIKSTIELLRNLGILENPKVDYEEDVKDIIAKIPGDKKHNKYVITSLFDAAKKKLLPKYGIVPITDNLAGILLLIQQNEKYISLFNLKRNKKS